MTIEQVTEEGSFSYLEQPAIYVDHCSVSVFRSGIVRFSFAEYVTNDIVPLYRVGLAMPLVDAKRLVRKLARAIKTFEEEEKEADESGQKTSEQEQTG
jgi:hypothetical protein